MLVETKNDLASRILLNNKFTKRENGPFETVEPHKKFDYNWWTIGSGGLLDYTKEEMEAMCLEWMIQVIMPEK